MCMRYLLLTVLLAASLMANDFVLKHREHNGVGYDTGYTSLTTFLLPSDLKEVYPLFDGRLHVFDDGHFAANIGGGLRVPFAAHTWALGANFFYDYRDDGAFKVNQLGPGLELLSRPLDFRLNGYIPLRSSTFISPNTSFVRFEGNNAIVRNSVRAALPCVQGAFGKRWANENLDFYSTLGSYYLFSNTADRTGFGRAWGGVGSALLTIQDHFFAGLDVTYDRIFRWTVQGVVGINALPRPKNIPRFLSQPIMRNEIIPIQKRTQRAPLIDPATGEPYFFLFVNNQSGSDGTFEDPFPMLVQAQDASSPGDIIYVFPGDGTTMGAMDGLVMKTSQILQGSGFDLPLSNAIIPAQTPGLLPVVTNTGGSGVTLGDLCTVRGIHVTAGATSNISDGGVSGNFCIEDCIISDSTEFGIDATGVLATILTLSGEKIVRRSQLFGNGVGGGGTDGAAAILAAPGTRVTFEDNFIDGQGISTNGLISAVFDDSEVNAQNNVFQGMTTGDIVIDRVDIGTTATYNVVNNQMLSTSSFGFACIPIIPIFPVKGSGVLNLRDNVFSNHVSAHILVEIGMRSECSCNNNVMTTVAATNVVFDQKASSTQFCLQLQNNTNPGSYSFLNATGDPANFQVEAPGASLVGLMSINTGTFIIAPPGSTTFVEPGSSCPP